MRDRFAPSPTGALHLGSAFSAFVVHDGVRAMGGTFIVRMEDLDRERCRPEHAAGILRDLAWLGLHWDEPVLYTSTRGAAHGAALKRLAPFTYCCTCSRREVAEAASAPQEGAANGPDGPVYPGTCRGGGADPAKPHVRRLDMRRAVAALGGAAEVAGLGFVETGAGPEGQSGRVRLDPDWLVDAVGDVALSRKDGVAAYHLAVVVDDAYQRITRVTRGRDLYTSTPLHRLLQALLELPTPDYHHHPLIRDPGGQRLAKRDGARHIAALREDGANPADIRRMVGLQPLQP